MKTHEITLQATVRASDDADVQEITAVLKSRLERFPALYQEKVKAIRVDAVSVTTEQPPISTVVPLVCMIQKDGLGSWHIWQNHDEICQCGLEKRIVIHV